MTLRHTVKTPQADGLKLSGLKRLTELAVKKLKIFYELAIRRNVNNLAAMKLAVWALYFHLMSIQRKNSQTSSVQRMILLVVNTIQSRRKKRSMIILHAFISLVL